MVQERITAYENMETSKWLKREAWLSEYGQSESDVMMERNGTEYILVSQGFMDEGEAEEENFIKMELPHKLQVYYTPF